MSKCWVNQALAFPSIMHSGRPPGPSKYPKVGPVSGREGALGQNTGFAVASELHYRDDISKRMEEIVPP